MKSLVSTIHHIVVLQISIILLHTDNCIEILGCTWVRNQSNVCVKTVVEGLWVGQATISGITCTTNVRIVLVFSNRNYEVFCEWSTTYSALNSFHMLSICAWSPVWVLAFIYATTIQTIVVLSVDTGWETGLHIVNSINHKAFIIPVFVVVSQNFNRRNCESDLVLHTWHLIVSEFLAQFHLLVVSSIHLILIVESLKFEWIECRSIDSHFLINAHGQPYVRTHSVALCRKFGFWCTTGWQTNHLDVSYRVGESVDFNIFVRNHSWIFIRHAVSTHAQIPALLLISRVVGVAHSFIHLLPSEWCWFSLEDFKIHLLIEHTFSIEEFKVVEGVHLGSFHIIDVGIVHIVLMWNSDCWAVFGIVRIVSWRIWRNHRSINLHRIRLFCAINDVANTEVDVVLTHHPVAPVASVSGRCLIFMTNSIRICLHQHSDGAVFLHRERAVLRSFVHSTNAKSLFSTIGVVEWVEEVKTASPIQTARSRGFGVISRKACTAVVAIFSPVLRNGMNNVSTLICCSIVDEVAITATSQSHTTLRNLGNGSSSGRSEFQAVELSETCPIITCRHQIFVVANLYELSFV